MPDPVATFAEAQRARSLLEEVLPSQGVSLGYTQSGVSSTTYTTIRSADPFTGWITLGASVYITSGTDGYDFRVTIDGTATEMPELVMGSAGSGGMAGALSLGVWLPVGSSYTVEAREGDSDIEGSVWVLEASA